MKIFSLITVVVYSQFTLAGEILDRFNKEKKEEGSPIKVERLQNSKSYKNPRIISNPSIDDFIKNASIKYYQKFQKEMAVAYPNGNPTLLKSDQMQELRKKYQAEAEADSKIISSDLFFKKKHANNLRKLDSLSTRESVITLLGRPYAEDIQNHILAYKLNVELVIEGKTELSFLPVLIYFKNNGKMSTLASGNNDELYIYGDSPLTTSSNQQGLLDAIPVQSSSGKLEGYKVTLIESGGEAEKMGLKVNDIIISVSTFPLDAQLFAEFFKKQQKWQLGPTDIKVKRNNSIVTLKVK